MILNKEAQEQVTNKITESREERRPDKRNRRIGLQFKRLGAVAIPLAAVFAISAGVHGNSQENNRRDQQALDALPKPLETLPQGTSDSSLDEESGDAKVEVPTEVPVSSDIVLPDIVEVGGTKYEVTINDAVVPDRSTGGLEVTPADIEATQKPENNGAVKIP